MIDDKILQIGNHSIVLAFGPLIVNYLFRAKDPACRLIGPLQTYLVSDLKPLVKPFK